MNTLHVMLPSFTHLQGDVALRRWLARGDRPPAVADARTVVLHEVFRFAGEGLPVAALRHHCHAGDAAIGAWLCADPCYVRSEMAGARLLAFPLDDMSADEAGQIASALRALCGDAGVPLTIDTPAAWCLHLPHDAPVATFVEPAEALGASLLDCLPAGESGRMWRRLFNEIQIALHAHPVNAARIAAGRLPANALWFWGAGRLPGAVDSELAFVASEDDVVRGLAKCAEVRCAAPTTELLASNRDSGDVLLDLATLKDADATRTWLASLRRALRERQFDTLALTFAGGERFRLRRRHRFRFWRQA
jgi:hypothetical protein